MSVRPYDRFSRPLTEIQLYFFLCTFLSYKSIYSTNILSVSVCRAGYKRQKCKNMDMRFFRPPFQLSVVHTYLFLFQTASLLMDVVFLVFLLMLDAGDNADIKYDKSVPSGSILFNFSQPFFTLYYKFIDYCQYLSYYKSMMSILSVSQCVLILFLLLEVL